MYLRIHNTGVPVELQELDLASPCLRCYPDAPRATSVHTRCMICSPKATRPCQHNGGVRVPMKRVRRKQTLFQEPGEEFYSFRYVWPESAHNYVSV